MSTVAVLNKNCYALQNENIYNSLHRKKSASNPVSKSWWEIHRRPIFISLIFTLVVGLILIFAIAACSLSIGFFINKSPCEKHVKQNGFPYLLSMKINGSGTTTNRDSQNKTMAAEKTTRTILITHWTNVSGSKMEQKHQIKGHTGQINGLQFYRINKHVYRTKRRSSSIPSPFLPQLRSHRVKRSANLEGRVFKIHTKDNYQCLYFDGATAKSCKWIQNGNFVKFTFEKQIDGSYKIKSFGRPRYMYDGYNVSDALEIYLNGYNQTDDDHMRYYITMETQGYFRIKTKATNRYVRLDPDEYVSSRFNIADDRSLFQFIEVDRVNLQGKVFQIFELKTGEWWYYEGNNSDLKAVRQFTSQPRSDFLKFTFEKQMDGSYKIKSFAVPRYIYDGYNVSGARGVYLNGNDQTDDDHMRYYITMETPKSYRIKTKATNRYVRLDAIGYVSSRLNRADARSLFRFAEMHTVNIEGKVFKIQAKENNQFWHFDGGNEVLKVVSSLVQPNDDYVKFTFEKQTDDSYKIKSFAMPRYMYDGYNVSGARGIYLNGDDQTDDDHMRFFVTMETQDFYRIQTKATNRYVRLDSDNYVSSRENIADDRSLFKLVVV